MILAIAIGIVVVVVILTAGLYFALTLPCENGFHRRHWRFRRFRPGGCSAIE